MSELKPCPFCGGKAELHKVEFSNELQVNLMVYTVACCMCNATTSYYVYADHAVDAWNRRAE